MQFPAGLKYTKDHEWAKINETYVTVGITDYAQDKLGDIVFVELEEPGTQLKQGDKFGTVESVKSVSDLFIPFSGKIIEINKELLEHPEIINKEPFGRGWMIKISTGSIDHELSNLLDTDAYEKYCKESD
ncbi:MAG: glycine cleavage system protein GcvH [Deltaproteobacteria bacterium]|nr:glycine cleavage system protein GcvH [Deltaproteobacteria bacterium]